MTTYVHTCEGTDGAQVTNSNAPAGSNNFSSVTKGASGQLEFDTARSMHDTSSILVSSPVTGTTERSYFYWNFDAPTKSACMRVYFYTTALPATTTHIMSLNGAGTIRQAQLSLQAGGLLLLQDSGNTTVNGPTLSVNTWYRIEMSATTLGTPAFSVHVYSGDSLVDNAATLPSPVFTGDFTMAMHGKFTAGGTWGPIWFDSVKAVTESAALIGPEVLATLPFGAASGAGWTTTGAASMVAALSDSLDSSYVQTTANPSAMTLDLTLPSLAAPTSDLLMRVRARRDGAVSGNLVATLRDGTTTVATASTVTLDSALATYLVTFPWAQISGVTAQKWRDGTLVTRLSVTAV